MFERTSVTSSDAMAHVADSVQHPGPTSQRVRSSAVVYKSLTRSILPSNTSIWFNFRFNPPQSKVMRGKSHPHHEGPLSPAPPLPQAAVIRQTLPKPHRPRKTPTQNPSPHLQQAALSNIKQTLMFEWFDALCAFNAQMCVFITQEL